MIELHPVTLADKHWIDPLVWAEGSSSADFNFGNIYLWDKSFHQLVGKCHDRVIVVPRYEKEPFFAYPVGTGALAPVLEEPLGKVVRPSVLAVGGGSAAVRDGVSQDGY